MSNVIIHQVNGQSFVIPEANLENTRRLLGSQIASIEYENQNLESILTESINEELVVEIIDDTPQTDKKGATLEELKNSDKDVLRELADKIAEDKGIAKANHRSGVDKLAEYIVNNR